MRKPLTTHTLQTFMTALADVARSQSRVYLVGGASALLLGWRDSTIDVDLKLVPESDEILRSLPQLKEKLGLNIELASPDDFIPELPGWQDRSTFIRRVGKLSFYHYDFYAQALAKIERGHDVDRTDALHLIETGLIKPAKLLELYSAIEGQLFRYPELDRQSFRRAVEHFVESTKDRN